MFLIIIFCSCQLSTEPSRGIKLCGFDADMEWKNDNICIVDGAMAGGGTKGVARDLERDRNNWWWRWLYSVNWLKFWSCVTKFSNIRWKKHWLHLNVQVTKMTWHCIQSWKAGVHWRFVSNFSFPFHQGLIVCYCWNWIYFLCKVQNLSILKSRFGISDSKDCTFLYLHDGETIHHLTIVLEKYFCGRQSPNNLAKLLPWLKFVFFTCMHGLTVSNFLRKMKILCIL